MYNVVVVLLALEEIVDYLHVTLFWPPAFVDIPPEPLF
jgi:hypothetical protein